MYLDIRPVHGGAGDTFFMLYFEEWRMAGHYQSLEPDPSVKKNKVIDHFNWRMKSLANTFHSNQSEASAAACAPGPSGTPACPSSSPSICPPMSPSSELVSTLLATSTLPRPRGCPPTVSSQRQSTRQRIVSDGAFSVSEIVSPIRNREANLEETPDNQAGLCL